MVDIAIQPLADADDDKTNLVILNDVTLPLTNASMVALGLPLDTQLKARVLGAPTTFSAITYTQLAATLTYQGSILGAAPAVAGEYVFENVTLGTGVIFVGVVVGSGGTTEMTGCTVAGVEALEEVSTNSGLRSRAHIFSATSTVASGTVQVTLEQNAGDGVSIFVWRIEGDFNVGTSFGSDTGVAIDQSTLVLDLDTQPGDVILAIGGARQGISLSSITGMTQSGTTEFIASNNTVHVAAQNDAATGGTPETARIIWGQISNRTVGVSLVLRPTVEAPI